jgi:flavin-dependent thymidylate synthase
MAKVSLLYYTGKDGGTGLPGDTSTDPAAQLLVFTKNTRLQMTPDGFEELMDKLDHKSFEAELQAMAETIPSSWEFVDVIFAINDVTRACAQQMTRTRNASYAMQSQRVVDMEGFGYEVGPSILKDDLLSELYRSCMNTINGVYKTLTQAGAKSEDARGVLPMNVHCNLIAKYNLRAFVELVRSRRSLRTQGEYANIVDMMYNAVIEVWPWAAPFFVPKHEAALRILGEVVKEIGITTGSGPGWKVAKAMDLLRDAT